jgi:hypothetical protein
MMAQHDLSAQGRRKLASKGTARPDGSYPISDQQDIENAVKDWARTGRPGAVRAWIEKRARTLDLEVPAALNPAAEQDELAIAKAKTAA